MKCKIKPICKVDRRGTKRWRLNGKLHREDGPAIERHDGTTTWYLNNEWHRIDGPAIEWGDGAKYWYLEGKEYTEQDYWNKLYKLGMITKEELFLKLL